MRLLFTRFPLESAHGGAEIQTLSLMKGLSERGHAVAFLGSCPVLLEETAKLRLPHAKIEIGPPPVTKWHAISFLWRKQKMQQRLEAAINEFCHPERSRGMDAIFMLSLSEKLLLTEAAVAKGIKVFWIEHDRVGPWLRNNPWLSMLRKLSATATTICVSELSRNIYSGFGWDPERVITIPNGIDLKKFCPKQDSQSAIRNPPFRLGCVARLSPEKGIDVLLHAIADLPDVSLTIVGTGPEETRLRSTITQFAIRNPQSVTLLPRVDNLRDFYRGIDALILPSRDNDPFGLVVAEAMACGTPVIVTDQCGIAGYLTNGIDALIVKADSVPAVRDAIERMRDHALRSRLAIAGVNTAREQFSLQRMIEMYERLLRKNR